MLLRDFECLKCGAIREELVSSDDVVVCRKCENPMVRVFIHAPPILTTIIPSYKGCLRQRAGYTHTHGDFDATRIQSGYGGCQSPKK